MILPPLGCVLVALGVAGDSYGWWDNRGFLTNLLSSFTGLLFAIPFALVVLSRLGDAHARLAEQREVRRFATRTFDSLVEAVTLLDAFKAELDRASPANLEGRFESLHRESGSRVMLAVESSWMRLRDDVRPRLAEVDLPWLSLASEEHLERRLRQVREHYDALLPLSSPYTSPVNGPVPTFSGSFALWAIAVDGLRELRAGGHITFDVNGRQMGAFPHLRMIRGQWEWPTFAQLRVRHQ